MKTLDALNSEGKNLLYLCELPAFHVSNEIYVMKKAGFNVIVLNLFKKPFDKIESNISSTDMHLYNLYNNLKYYPKIKFVPFFTRFIDIELIESLIIDNEINIIYSSWSSNVLPEAYVIKKRHPEIKWVHRFLMYPASMNAYKVIVENFIVKKYIKKIDKIIVNTEEMKFYIETHAGADGNKINILNEKLNETYFLEEYSNEIEYKNEFHLIFLGNFDLESKENNILKLIRSFSKNIYVHISIKKKDKYILKNNPNIIHFDRVMFGQELTSLIQKFDGILVAYSESSGASDRANNVIPNRVTMGLPALKPFFILKNQLSATRNFLKNYNMVFEFDDGAGLSQAIERSKLVTNDRNIIKEKLMLDFSFIDNFM